ncbi:MAG: hypothetical protein GX308_01830 [Epulopiscium sp.]|nr:hypothetical protein [Candidatus Epulonipiscium sp.]
MAKLEGVSSVHIARKYFIYIALENLLDMILTLYATINGHGVEINPLLSSIVQDPFLFVMIKGVIPTLLLIFVFLRLSASNPELIRKSIRYLKLCFCWYLMVLSTHIVWISFLL